MMNDQGSGTQVAVLDQEMARLFAAIGKRRVAVSISDMADPELPLVYVNSEFERLTGYSATEVIGRNCRFLQGDETDRGAVGDIRDALARKRGLDVCLINYKASGQKFHNLLMLKIFKTPDDRQFCLGCQYNITNLIDPKEMRDHIDDVQGVAEDLRSLGLFVSDLIWDTLEARTAAMLHTVDAHFTRLGIARLGWG